LWFVLFLIDGYYATIPKTFATFKGRRVCKISIVDLIVLEEIMLPQSLKGLL
jgi:hypothetical protein